MAEEGVRLDAGEYEFGDGNVGDFFEIHVPMTRGGVKTDG